MSPADYIQGAVALALKLDDHGHIVGGKAIRRMDDLRNVIPDVIIWSRPPARDEEAFANSRLKQTRGVQFVCDPHPLSVAERLVHEEKESHIARGYTASHDDTHEKCELANAARCYIWHAVTSLTIKRECTTPPPSWPWSRAEFKGGPALWMLVKAASLILAEIERLLRREPASITTHPRFESLKARFGWDAKRGEFPAVLPRKEAAE